VARWAHGSGLTVVVTGTFAERGLAERVARLAGLDEQAVLAGQTTIDELAAIVADASLVVCGDTGVAHLATAYGTPSVVLFGPMSPAEWGPPSNGPHVVLWHGDARHASGGGGNSLGVTPDASLLSITVEEVVAAASGLLPPVFTPPTGPDPRTTPASA